MAGRKPNVRYYKSRGGYFATYRGKLHRLEMGPDDATEGPTYRAALRKWLEIQELADAPARGDNNSFRICAERFIAHLIKQTESDRRAKGTLKIRMRDLTPTLNFQLSDGRLLGDLAVRELKPLHFRE